MSEPDTTLDELFSPASRDNLLAENVELKKQNARLAEVLEGLYRSTAALRFGVLAMQPARRDSLDFKTNANYLLAAEKLLLLKGGAS